MMRGSIATHQAVPQLLHLPVHEPCQPAQDAEQSAARAMQDVGSWEEERQQLQTEVRSIFCDMLPIRCSLTGVDRRFVMPSDKRDVLLGGEAISVGPGQ